MTVWLRRQEQRVHETRIIAQGLTDVILASKGESHVQESFQKFVDAVYPFLGEQQKDRDIQMKDLMKREADKGVITFQAADENFVKRRAKVMQMDDEWSSKLRKRAEKKK